MTQENYRDRHPDHLLDQYRLYVEMADRVTARRSQANRFYVSLLSGLLALLSVLVGRNIFGNFLTVVFTAIAVLGIALCSLWYVTIGSYRQLNAGKFKVIHEMEENLPFACYTKEWRILRTEEGGKKYRRLTRVEQRVPLVMAVLYVLLLVYSVSILLA